MPVREFVGKSTAEILENIRRRLGPDAMIVGPLVTRSSGPAAIGGALLGINACRPSELREDGGGAAGGGALPELIRSLQRSGVGERVGRIVIEGALARLAPAELADPQRIMAAVVDAIAMATRPPALIEPGAGRPRRVAFVGASGAGKTTALLKLAAQLAGSTPLLRVGALGTGAARQSRLGALAAVMGITVETIESPRDWKRLVAGARHGLAFLDTAGVNAARPESVARIKTFLCDAGFDETQIVIAGPSGSDEARELLAEMRGTPSPRILITKVDESVALGRVLDLVLDSDTPASYLSSGAGISDDMLPADRTQTAALATRVLRRIAGGAAHGGESGG